jgi:HK97 family phage major capsid protein
MVMGRTSNTARVLSEILAVVSAYGLREAALKETSVRLVAEMNTKQIAILKREVELALRDAGFSRDDASVATAIAARNLLDGITNSEHQMKDENATILEAIESSTASFVKFKAAQEQRFEDLEAKMKRPGNGADDGDVPVRSVAKSVLIDPSAPEVKSFARYMRTGQMEQKDMSGGSNADGGYAIPKEIDAAIEAVLLKQSPLRPYCLVQPITTPDYHKLVNKRGFGASWVGETAARPATTTAQFADIKPPMGELYANPQATQQMLDDVFFDAPSWLANELGVAFAESESNTFINGNGTNQPLGFLAGTPVATADATRTFGVLQYVPTTNATGFAAVTSTASPFDILQQTIFSMRPGYRKDAIWVMHPTTLAVLAQVKDTVGRPIMVPSLIVGQPPTIMGYPVVECEHMPLIGANAFPIAFGNFSRGYIIVDRMNIRVLQDPFSNKPYVGFYTTKRVGGQVMNSECIKLVKCSVS